ncbi:MAG: hypothetical protein WC273_08780 [Dehalococcoidia bacterium]
MIRRWRARARWLVLPSLAAIALAIAGCGLAPANAGARIYPDSEAPAVTVNIDVSEQGYEPIDVRVPAGPSIQLILRNRSKDEYHYRVQGLDATQILWLAPREDMTREAGVTDDEHGAHHAKDFIDWRGTSPGGVKPTLTEVHAYVAGTGVDVLRFYALKPGTYQVVDPLHPALHGTLTVFVP